MRRRRRHLAAVRAPGGRWGARIKSGGAPLAARLPCPPLRAPGLVDQLPVAHVSKEIAALEPGFDAMANDTNRRTVRLAALVLVAAATLSSWQGADAIDLMKLFDARQHRSFKRAGEPCHPYEPFKCPGDGACISIQYLCDGAPDCPDGYDEDLRLCTAAKRPPVEETANFLQALLNSHGPNFLEKLFGVKARNALEPLGGVERVAIALSESQTIGDFAGALRLMRNDVEHLRSIFTGVQNGDMSVLANLGIKDAEIGDVKFFLEKLIKTGFLD